MRGVSSTARSGYSAKSYRTEAIVLRHHKLGEADRIVVLLTPDHGQIRAVAKGVRRTSSKLGATLEPFMHVDLQLIHGKNLDTITQAQLLHQYGAPIAASYQSYTAAAAMVETAERLTSTDVDTTGPQFRLLHGALAMVARGEGVAATIMNSYLLRALSTAGWAPSFTDCARCTTPGPHEALNIQLGGSVCASCRPAGSRSPAPGTIRLLAALLTGNWATVAQASAGEVREADSIVGEYVQWHLERALKSLRLVERTPASEPPLDPPPGRRFSAARDQPHAAAPGAAP
ncbi:DNA repair protein RecO [Galactobacter caseinivorans]|uniref:DNA repair protein RecO n=1 Tax=Galactobacter caseinivorans TaxID=2676123 RepID=A0A496PKU8_9MICC|nr:DNA repair protein RecO [Galactobacter caseinivorans]